MRHQFNRGMALVLAAWGGTLCAGSAQAQSIYTPGFETAIPFTYDRGRNTSVLQRARPDYSAIGILAGGFTLYPSMSMSAGFTTNAYQATTSNLSDGFVTLTPQVVVKSNWSVHRLAIDTGGNFVRYFKATTQNENGWHVDAEGKIDVSSRAAISLTAKTAQEYESRFSGAALNNIQSATPYQVSMGEALADIRFDRLRTVIEGDYSDFNFKSIRTLDGLDLNQDNRDRGIARVSGYAEYGLTPDAGLFVQATYTNTDYRHDLASTIENRNSNEIRSLAGLSLDVSALIRGSIGVGYAHRDYKSPAFKSFGGVSVTGRIEYFPTELTTVTLTVRREIEDATIGTSGYFDTGGALRVDHELLRNLILNLGIDYEVDKYEGSGSAHVVRTGGGARYLVNHLFELNFDANYGHRTNANNGLDGAALNEFRTMIGVTVHP